MHKSHMIACLAVLLTCSAPALAQAPGGGAPGSSSYPGGGAPGASASSAGTSGAASSSADGGLGVAAGEPNGSQGGHEGGPPPELSGEKLAEVKTKILAHMDENIGEIQKRKACVQAAADGAALKACMPPRRGPGGQGGQGGGPEGSQRDK